MNIRARVDSCIVKLGVWIFVLAVALGCTGRVIAGEPVGVGWWGDFWYEQGAASTMYKEGVRTLVIYNEGGGDAKSGANPFRLIDQFLTDCKVAGIRAVIEIPRVAVMAKEQVMTKETNPENSWYWGRTGNEVIKEYVLRYKDNPAVYGWLVADEPNKTDLIDEVKNVSDIIRANSTKPISIVFSGWVGHGMPKAYAAYYDLMLYDKYPCRKGQSEFEDFGGKDGFTRYVADVTGVAETLGKPWWMVTQSFGRQPGGKALGWTWRLPTLREQRFMTYYAIIKGAKQIVNWKRYRNLRSLPEPMEPYPYDGPMWRKDVFEPLAAEINIIGAALDKGAISGAIAKVNGSIKEDSGQPSETQKDDANWFKGVTAESGDLKAMLQKVGEMTANVFQDPETGKYYLLVVNVYKDVTAKFTLNLPEKITKAVPLDGSAPIVIKDGVFSDHFIPFEAAVYQLVPIEHNKKH